MRSADAAQPLGWLDAAVVTGTVVTLATVAAAHEPGIGLVAVALAAALVTWFVRGRRTTGGRPGWFRFVVVLVAVSFVGALITPTFATFQVVVLPVAWLVTPGFRSGLVVNAVLAAAIALGYLRTAGPAEAVAVESVSFGFSVVMGAWITRIEQRSDQRQALVDRLTAAQQQIAALNRDAGTVAERQRLARELHDTVAQSLAGVVMMAERARAHHPDDAALVVLEDAARQAMTEARGLVTATAGVPLDGGLAAALDTLAARFRRETGLAVQVDVRAEVPRGLEVVLLRCAQEGLANVRKHAAARTVALRVALVGGTAVLTVIDDGAGPGSGEGFGVAGMRDRLALVGGSVDLLRADGGGAALTVRVPTREAVAP